MAHSRLEKIGTIYSRVTGLIRAGAMKLEDRPLWYEVYQQYPPEVEPKFNREAPDTKIREIFYPEDTIRAKFHKKVLSELPTWDLTSKEESVTQRMVSVCQKLQSDSGLEPNEAFDQALETIRQEGLLVRSTKEIKQSKAKETNESTEKPPSPPTAVDIKNIFNT